MPSAFNDAKRVTKSYMPTANAPVIIDVSKGQPRDEMANKSNTHLKRGRTMGSKDKVPRKLKGQMRTL